MINYEAINRNGETKRAVLNLRLANRKSVVDYVNGYYIEVGNQNTPSLHVPIFDAIPQSNGHNTKVRIDYLGSAMWINVRSERVFIGGEHRIYGQNKQRKLEQIKGIS